MKLVKKYFCCDEGGYSGDCPPSFDGGKFMFAALNPYAFMEFSGEGFPAPVTDNQGANCKLAIVGSIFAPTAFSIAGRVARFCIRDSQGVNPEIQGASLDIMGGGYFGTSIAVDRALLAGYDIVYLQISKEGTTFYDWGGIVFPFTLDTEFGVLKLMSPFNRDSISPNPLTLIAGNIVSHFESVNKYFVEYGMPNPKLTVLAHSFAIGDFGNGAPYTGEMGINVNNLDQPDEGFITNHFPEVFTDAYDSAGFSDGIGLAIVGDYFIDNGTESAHRIASLLATEYGLAAAWLAVKIGITP